MGRDPPPFGDVLRQFRTAAWLSQEALAERAGLSLRGISDLERGVRRAPHLTTVGLLADALALATADRQALLAAARPPCVPPSPSDAHPEPSLPVPLTALIDRERELAALISLLANTESRLVTVTGPGGSGKTRLALEVAARLRDTFEDGVAFVELTPLRDAELVIPTIAGALGVRDRSGQRLRDTLSGFLRARQMLLLIDNCEHVLSAAPEIAALLTAAPRLSVLATSREAFRVRGERAYLLHPLPLPEPANGVSLEDVAGAPAVMLFIERAAINDPRFELTPDNAPVVAAICRRLDGLPLAIELAAARLRVLTPMALLARLERRLPLLTSGSRDLPVRQRTMRDAIAWSYDLLAPQEQSLFRCLAVFAGGGKLDAVQAVCGWGNEFDVLEGLETLLHANLVQPMELPDGERRFTMLETIREFGLERLAASGETELVGGRHVDYFLTLAEAAGASTAVAMPEAWVLQLEAETGNLRATLAWLRDRGASAEGLRLVAALGGFWRVRSANAEGRMWLETFLVMPMTPEAPTTARIAALRWAGELAGLHGDLTTAEARLAESLALARKANDARGAAAALGSIASALFQNGDVAAGIPLFGEAIELTRAFGDVRQTAFLLAYLATAVGQHGDPARAHTLIAESTELLGSLGDTLSFEANLVVLAEGLLALMAGNSAQAENRLGAALCQGRALSAMAMVSVALGALGEVALARGDAAKAARHYREGLMQGWEGDYPVGIVWNLLGLTRIGSRQQQHLAVARVAGALDQFSRVLRALPRTVVVAYEDDAAKVRAVLGEDTFAEARKVGQASPLEDTIAEALKLANAQEHDHQVR